MITIVTGPPCSGKSTYIRQHAKAGDIVIDMDRLALALTAEDTKPFEYSDKVRKIARAARGAAVREALAIAQGERYLGVYIIHTDPSPDQRMMYRAANARVVEVNPGKEVCLERLKSRPPENQQIARKVIDEYYAIR
jgi:dephospho-CoA kinase